MTKYFTLSIFALFALNSFFLISTEKKVYRIDTNKKDDQNCQLKALDQCLNKAYYFTHRSNVTEFSADEKEFDNMCRAVVKVINCMDKYFQRCSYPIHKEVYQMGKDQFYQSWKQMCTEGPIRDNYIKNSPCIQEALKQSPQYRNTCVNNLQVAFEKATSLGTLFESFNIGCCAFNEWQDCIDELLEEKCGSDGIQAVKSLIVKASGGTIYNLCSKEFFDPKTQLCREVLPKPGTQANLNQTDSMINRYLSYFGSNSDL